jgi:hypothetical protein
MLTYIEQLIDAEGHPATRGPSPTPWRCTPVKAYLNLKVSDRYVIDAGGKGQFYAEVFPSMTRTVVQSANIPEPVSSDPIMIKGGGWLRSDLLQDLDYGIMSRRCLQNAARQSNGAFGFAIEGVLDPTNATFQMTLDDETQGTAECQIGYSTPSSSTFVELITFQELIPGRQVALPFTIPINASVIMLRFQALGDYADRPFADAFDFVANLAFLAGGVGCPNIITLGTSTTFDLLNDVNDLRMYTLRAFEVRGTYMGSDLSNGGRLAVAKVPTEWSVIGPNALEEIAKLPYDMYEGPLKDGFDIHWFPSSIDDLTPTRPVAQESDHLFKYVIAIEADIPTQTFRLRLTSHVDYNSDSPSYGAMEYGPSSSGLSLALEYLARSIPICTENSNHIVKKMLNLAKSKSKEGFQYVLDNPQVLAQLAALVL